MVPRRYWIRRVEEAWRRRSVVWLAGVRRVGKTCLSLSLKDVEYFDCELPRVRRLLEDPEAFLAERRGQRVILDEIHRLPNPSEILKIAADHYPDVRILATGSSFLGASARFRDTLTGRKAEVWLTPMITDDLRDFGNTDLSHRFLHGGLPPFFLAAELPERDFQEWMDAFWAKDILELFRLERRYSFLRFMELLFATSGGIFEATRFARPCEVSRTTISNYLSVLEATYVAHVIRPYSTHRPSEIVAAPKVYAFDTGFVCYFRGWVSLRPDDYGYLWEHFVLNELQAKLETRDIRYWRDKKGHEVDFVIPLRRGAIIAIEAKWKADAFSPQGLKALVRRYPNARCYVVTSDVAEPYSRTIQGVKVRFVNLAAMVEEARAALSQAAD
ncbi:TPA: ATPase [Candidatus Acetothermia bacterium]|nr:ATPase [Candidatus Acetothermia bacterium]